MGSVKCGWLADFPLQFGIDATGGGAVGSAHSGLYSIGAATMKKLGALSWHTLHWILDPGALSWHSLHWILDPGALSWHTLHWILDPGALSWHTLPWILDPGALSWHILHWIYSYSQMPK
jgi:hypothetical protein